MPEQQPTTNPANFQGGTGDYWDGFRDKYWGVREEIAELRDSMSVTYDGGNGQGSGFEAFRPPTMRYVEDAQAAGAISLAGELN